MSSDVPGFPSRPQLRSWKRPAPKYVFVAGFCSGPIVTGSAWSVSTVFVSDARVFAKSLPCMYQIVLPKLSHHSWSASSGLSLLPKIHFVFSIAPAETSPSTFVSWSSLRKSAPPRFSDERQATSVSIPLFVSFGTLRPISSGDVGGKSPHRVAYDDSAPEIVSSIACVEFVFELSSAFTMPTVVSATRIPMMQITTSNSTRVNPEFLILNPGRRPPPHPSPPGRERKGDPSSQDSGFGIRDFFLIAAPAPGS